MPLISALLPHARRAGRVDVMVDGASVGTLTLEAVERLGVRVGGDFEVVRARFEQECARLAVWDRATGLLAVRARGRVELRRLLLRKGAPAALVDPMLDQLEQAGYLNDADFAHQFARNRLVSRGQSRRRVQQELARRGVSRDAADAAIEAVVLEEPVDGAGAAERLARKKLATLQDCDLPTKRRRLYAFLARRGFENEKIREVLGRLGRELAED